ncbi:MAG: PAS domain S-box protein [Methanoregula sp.]|nr:PAS domain S-box protein [Methanoregula sp.]
MISILYVDDEPALLELGKLFLERSKNFTVDTAVSGAEAITKLQSGHYDGIISDYQMPEMDGIAFLKYVRTHYEYLPFVLFTGRGREEVVIEALNNGADFYIQKGGDPISQFVELEYKVTVAINKKQTECHLEDSRQRINDIVNFLPDATFAIDCQGEVIVWNRSMEEMTGIKAGDILGTANYSYAIPFYGERRPVLIDLVLREDKEIKKKYPWIVKLGDKLISENFIQRLNDGKGAYISFTVAPLYDNKGHVAGAIESIRDITELKQVQDALRSSEEQYRTVFETTGTATVLIEENTVISLANREFERLSGYPKQEIEGKKRWTEFVVKDDLDRMLAQHRLRRERQEAALKHYEFRFVTKSGDIRHIFLTIDMIPGTKKSVASLMDITERKEAEEQLRCKNTELHAAYEQLTATEEELRQNYDELSKKEQALQESEEKYRTIFENAGDAIAIHDLEGHFVEVNDVICRRFGYTRKELLKMRIVDVDNPDHAKEVGAQMGELTKKGHVIFETVHIARDGRQIPTEVSAVLFHLGNTPLVMSIARDITGRRRMEDALRESGKKYRDLVELLPQTVFELDERGFIASINQTGLKTFGITQEDLERGIDVIQGFVSGDRDRVGKTIQRILSREKLGGIEFTALRKDGSMFPVIIYADAILHQNTPVGVRGVLVDITGLKHAEEELRRTQHEMVAVLKDLRGVVVEYLDPSLTILWANEEMAKEFGISPNDVRGKHCYEVIQNRNERCPDCPAYTATQIQDIYEKEVTLPDGRLFLVRCNPVMDEKGSVAGIVHAMINITEHKRAEEALEQKNTELHAAYEQLTAGEEELQQSFDEISKKEQMVRASENNLKAILESLQSALVIIDSKTHTIVDANSVAIRMIGAPREEIIGHVCHKYICPADVGKCPISDLKQTIDLSERILLTASGEQVPILKSVTPKVISGHEYFIENLIDITECKRMEEQLRDAALRWQRTFDSTQDAICVLDVEQRIVKCNRTMLEICGVKNPDELVGRYCWEIVHGTQEPIPGCPLVRMRESLKRETMELKIGDHWFFVTTDPVLNERRMLVSSVHTLRDITERKRMEDALALASQKLNLLSGITRHDLLNQLTALRGYLELSRENVNDPVLSDFISKEEHIAGMIENLILFTRDYQDLGVNAPAWQNVNTVVGKAVKDLPLRDVRVDVDRTDPEVFADPLLERVFHNLVDNALRYGGEQMTGIRISSHERDTGLVIACEDDGVGISKGDKKHLFERGFGRHTGLGLFLSREILSITGITITETGEPGKGARFEITVPKGMYRFSGQE